MKQSLTPTSPCTMNFSQKVHKLRIKRNQDMISQAIQQLKNPFDPRQVSEALKFLENQVQRKALLDEIIQIREHRRKKEEFDKMSSMRGILTKVSKRFSIVKNQEVKYSRDHNDFKILQEERNKLDKLQYENLNLQVNEKRPQLRRMNSLSFLTKETDVYKPHTECNPEPQSLAFKRKTSRNSSLIVNAVIKKEIPTSPGRLGKNRTIKIPHDTILE